MTMGALDWQAFRRRVPTWGTYRAATVTDTTDACAIAGQGVS